MRRAGCSFQIGDLVQPRPEWRDAPQGGTVVAMIPTDEALAAAVEKIIVVVNEVVPKLKIQAPDIVRLLTNDEWAKLKEAEDRRRNLK
jgi:hypothetical protein